MSWNYRIVKYNNMFGIKEVYYTEGKISSWTKDFIEISGEEYMDLINDFNLVKLAFNKPILLEVDDKLIELGTVI